MRLGGGGGAEPGWSRTHQGGKRCSRRRGAGSGGRKRLPRGRGHMNPPPLHPLHSPRAAPGPGGGRGEGKRGSGREGEDGGGAGGGGAGLDATALARCREGPRRAPGAQNSRDRME